jgi:hypothetical protein
MLTIGVIVPVEIQARATVAATGLADLWPIQPWDIGSNLWPSSSDTAPHRSLG